MVLELRLALRGFRRSPARGLATALTLAIGVGATTAAFAAIDGVLLRDLPIRDQDEIVVAWQASDRTSIELPFSGIAFDVLAQGAGSLTELAGYSAWGALPVLVEMSGGDYSLRASYVAGDFFGVMGARPAMGRLLERADDEPGAVPVAVLSYSVWRTRYGADPAILGTTMVVADQTVTVVGVAPKGLDYPRGAELWYPLRADYANASARGGGPELHLIGRMAPGVDRETVAADIAATLAGDARVRSFMPDERIVVQSVEEQIVGAVQPVLYAAFLAAMVLLLVAGANATLFLLSGGRAAVHETAVRTALGADGMRLALRLLADASLVGVLACAAGWVFATAGLSVLTPLTPADFPRFESVFVGWRATGFAAIVTGIVAATTAVVAGLALSRLDLRTALMSGGRGGVGGRSRFRRGIAAVQVGLTVVSAVGAGLLVRTVLALESLDPGFSVNDMTAVSLHVPYPWFDVPEEYLSALEEAVSDLESRPGILAARPSLGPPLQQRLEVRLRTEGQTDEEFQGNPWVAVDAVLPGHFRAMGIPIRSGRDFTELDNRSDANPVVVVDESLARALWPGRDALGQRLIGYPGLSEMRFTVVGVAAATRYRELIDVHPRAYYPLRLLGNSPPSAILVRTADNSVPVQELVANAFAAADPQVRVLNARRMGGRSAGANDRPAVRRDCPSLLRGRYGPARGARCLQCVRGDRRRADPRDGCEARLGSPAGEHHQDCDGRHSGSRNCRRRRRCRRRDMGGPPRGGASFRRNTDRRCHSGSRGRGERATGALRRDPPSSSRVLG